MGHDHGGHNHESCGAHLLPKKWKRTFPPMFVGWGVLQSVFGGIVGSSSVVSNGLHDLGDGISFGYQAENSDGSTIDNPRRIKNREKANNILFGLGLVAVSKSGFEVAGHHLPEADIASSIKDVGFLALTGVSLAINTLAAKVPFQKMRKNFREYWKDEDNCKIAKHLAIDIVASGTAATSAVLNSKGILPIFDSLTGVGIGAVTMQHFQPKWFYDSVTKPVSELRLPDSALNMLSGNLVPRAGLEPARA